MCLKNRLYLRPMGFSSDTYEAIIGLEVHVQLQTQTKIFSSDSHAFGHDPNSQISAITLGLPGVLPKLNKEVVESAVKLGLATHCTITKENRFARKNYFYPDLPKGYQLTQDKTPICRSGHVNVRLDGKLHPVLIHHIHMEEDAGKSVHDQDPEFSLVDLNRAGTPLVEIVSEPCIKSAEEAYQYLVELRKLVRFLGISDILGTKVEIKNMNSLRNVRQAIEHEFERQVNAVENGETIIQQTRSFDVQSGTTAPMREKEDAHDYRYFPEPDLPPVVLSDDYISGIAGSLPALPEELFDTFTQQHQLSVQDSLFLTSEKEIADYFRAVMQYSSAAKPAANWMMGPIQSWCNAEGSSPDQCPVRPATLAAVIELIMTEKLSSSAAQQRLFPALLQQPNENPEQLATKLNLIQSQDDNFLDQLIADALEKHADKIPIYRNGKKGLFGVFMSEVIKGSKGKANPKIATEKLRKILDNE